MKTEVEFYSESFFPILPEECQVNPQVYGAELAWWLCQKLAEIGIYTSYPVFEDWCWSLFYTVEDNEYSLGCRNIINENKRWKIHLHCYAKKWFGFSKAPSEPARPLMLALEKILLESSEVSQVV